MGWRHRLFCLLFFHLLLLLLFLAFVLLRPLTWQSNGRSICHAIREREREIKNIYIFRIPELSFFYSQHPSFLVCFFCEQLAYIQQLVKGIDVRTLAVGVHSPFFCLAALHHPSGCFPDAFLTLFLSSFPIRSHSYLSPLFYIFLFFFYFYFYTYSAHSLLYRLR